jgi:hypothetical protein
MTGPVINVDQDQLQAAGGRWNTMSGDLDVGPPPHPGNDPTDPTVLATVAVHGTMHLTTAQLTEMLQSYASGTQNTASAFGSQDKGSASQMKELMSMLTGTLKDGEASLQGVFQGAAAGASSASSALSAGVSSVTSGIKPITAMMGKTNAPGGSVAGGLTDPNNINHDTTMKEGKDNGRSHTAESVSSH